MPLSESDAAYLAGHRSAAMITVDRQGIAKAVRIGLAVVDGRLWSSGTADRARTKRLRRDPRCTLFLFSDDDFTYRSLECEVTLLDGADAPANNLKLMRLMQGRPTGPLVWFGVELDEAAFSAKMVEEGRLVYEFDVRASYGST